MEYLKAKNSIRILCSVLEHCLQRLSLISILICLPVSLNAEVTVTTNFSGDYEAARSACLAWANPLGGGCGAGQYWFGQTYWEAGSLCANGNQGQPYCGDSPNEPEFLFQYFYYSIYGLGTSYENNQNMCTVGNPIDPVTGAKKHQESLINLSAQQQLVFDLFYDSTSLIRWSHTFNRRLNFSSVPTGNRFDLYNYGSVNGFNSVAEPETSNLFGGDVTEYGETNTAPVNTSQLYITKERACTSGWGAYKNRFNYSWINGSVAEYRITPLGGFAGIGQCYILDAPEGGVKMVLDIYELFSGKPSGHPASQGNLGMGGYLRFVRETGEAIVFQNFNAFSNVYYTGETVEKITEGSVITYLLHTAEDTTEEYSSDGTLLSITNAQGNVQMLEYTPVTDLLYQVRNQTGESITFTYETFGGSNQYSRIKSIISHDNRIWTFNYHVLNQTLESIDLPDTTRLKYFYDDPNDVQLLTGYEDESANRYSTWRYDDNGLATLSAHGVSEDIDLVEIQYSTNTGDRFVTTKRTSSISSPLDIVSTYKTHPGGGAPLVSEITGHNPIKYEHDAMTGYLEYVEDKGLRTEYSDYDERGNPGKIIEAAGTSEQRETSYTYDSRYHSKVATVTEPSIAFDTSKRKTTTIQSDDFGNNTAVTVDGFEFYGAPVTRTTTMEYNGPFHQLSLINGPRTDVSDIYTISYYTDTSAEGDNRARMKAIFAPENITLYSNINYSPTGKVKSYLLVNNVQATLLYYFGNDRLKSLELQDANTGEKRFTEWTYLATGEVETITTGFDVADKATLTFVYDDVHRLTGIVDGLGNTIEYTLDSEGNVENENIYDSNDILKKQLLQTFDTYNRLQLRTQVNEQFTETWLPNGTLDKVVDGKNITTNYDYDALKRLTTIIQDENGSSPQTADALTVLNYDVQDNLTYVKNPVNGETVYHYDDLGNQLSRTSDDTGLTTYSHDNAGNIKSMTDANGEIINYTYDALNRLTSITTSDTESNYQFQYDSCNNGIGRLCKVISNNSTQHYQYDAFGNITGQQALQYTYDTANRLHTITYPSGGVVEYSYDLAGQVQHVSLTRNGSTTPLAVNIAYEPFGDINNLLYGNGLTLSQSKDTAYRPLTQNILNVFELNYIDYDENGNIEQRDDTIANSSSQFTYDEHNRLNTATGDFGVRSYSYDKNANRTGSTENGSSTTNTYEPQSNRLSMRGLENATMDNNGNTLSIGTREYSYTKHNRLFEVFDNGVLKATYQYNGLGQRISKTLPDGTGKYFIYDTDGKLMAETDINGNILFEYIYLNNQLLAKYTPDTDVDGISNYQENQQGTNPESPDQDSDGLSDLDEIFIHGTSINKADSDEDGINDSEELAFNSNPLDSNTNYGDINLNGEFNIGDYAVLTQFVMGAKTPSPTEQQQADINQDGTVNIQDMLLMHRVLLGLQVSWSDFSSEKIKSVFTQLYNQIIPPAYAANGDGDIYYVHNDHLGTPVKMTNALGFIVWQAVYDPFGKATVDEDVDGDGQNIEMNVRFPGQYYDAESGLHYNYFRTYDPSLGRYITSDPIGLFGGINVFTYVGNNSLRFIDPLGLFNPYTSFANRVAAGIATPFLNKGLEENGINVNPISRIAGGTSSILTGGVIALNSTGVGVPIFLTIAGSVEIGTGIFYLNPEFFTNTVGKKIFELIECH